MFRKKHTLTLLLLLVLVFGSVALADGTYDNFDDLIAAMEGATSGTFTFTGSTNKDFTIPAGVTLVNNGTVFVFGGPTINGTMINNGTVTIVKESTLANNGTITNNGTINIETGACLFNYCTLNNYKRISGEGYIDNLIGTLYTVPNGITCSVSGPGPLPFPSQSSASSATSEPFTTAAAAQPQYEQRRVIGCRQWANVRTGPGTQYDIAGRVNLGDTIELLKWNEDETWCQIRFDGSSKLGWLHVRFILP